MFFLINFKLGNYTTKNYQKMPVSLLIIIDSNLTMTTTFGWGLNKDKSVNTRLIV